MTDDEILKMNGHIPNSEVRQDILDTKSEIENMGSEIPHLEALGRLGDKMARLRAESRHQGIEDRKLFIAKLERLLRLRGEEP